MLKKFKIALLASGNGSNAEVISDYFENHETVETTCFTDNPTAFVIKRFASNKKKVVYLPFEKNYDYFSQNSFDLYVLAGYMKIITPDTLKLGTFINIHPSLLPKYKGKNAIKRAYDAKEKITGVTIHYVDEHIDTGKIIVQKKLIIDYNEPFEMLEAKIHKIEHSIYPVTLKKIMAEMQK